MIFNDTKNTPSPFIDQKLCKFSQPGCQQAFANASTAFASAGEAIVRAGDWFASTGEASPMRTKGSPLGATPRRLRAPWPNGEAITSARNWFTSIGKDSPPLAKFHLHWRTFASEGEGFTLGATPRPFWAPKDFQTISNRQL
ncbi:hypothetical protein R1flu_008339 [Riccia fluitans]|uniref:Uncharacterized protein n=1 Tax=Riccia fluitans TaxID=41844 RepID=A0ABD1YF10_9MARC